MCADPSADGFVAAPIPMPRSREGSGSDAAVAPGSARSVQLPLPIELDEPRGIKHHSEIYLGFVDLQLLDFRVQR